MHDKYVITYNSQNYADILGSGSFYTYRFAVVDVFALFWADKFTSTIQEGMVN